LRTTLKNWPRGRRIVFRNRTEFDIQHKNEKEKLKKEYLRRLRLVLGTELSIKNKIQAIGP
jgi:hypothetical protein